ncbi:Uncharacterised protein [Mycobacterium tuberculosis]|nr:Uncharacterised protein [Mycobacterium tuberculosis]
MRDVDQGHLRSSAMLVGWMMSQIGRNVRLHVRGGHGGKQRVPGAAADRDPRHQQVGIPGGAHTGRSRRQRGLQTGNKGAQRFGFWQSANPA